ncbi:MAG: hypothetical protein PHU93_03720, partial [Candidatus Gracilibacteria bacterium]|nr:hypothetical protein [Candidatus Gracilibacteria bacterium]
MTQKGLLKKDIPANQVTYFLSYKIMLTNFKKLMAVSSAVAIVAMNLVPAGVGAAAVNDGVAADGVAAGITITGTITGSTATVRVEKDGLVTSATSGTVSAGVLTIADPDGTANGIVDNGYYVITFNTDTNDFGSATFSKNATYNQVNVTATVVPTLSLTLTGSAVTFGVLTPDQVTNGSATPVLTVKTNASLGYALQVTSATGALASGSDRINSATANLTATADGYGLQATMSGGTVNAIYGGTLESVGAVSTTPANLMTGNRTAGD